MARLKIDRTTLDLQVKIRDCWVLVGVGPYPPCTQTSAAATGIFEGGVGNPTRYTGLHVPTIQLHLERQESKKKCMLPVPLPSSQPSLSTFYCTIVVFYAFYVF